MVLTEILTGLCILTGCIGLPANLVLVYKLYKSRVQPNPLQMVIVGSDLFVCVVACPLKVYGYLYSPSICTSVLLDVFQELPMSCATLSMMFLAVDRFCVINKFEPFGRKVTREQTLPYVVGVTWLLAAILVLLEAISCNKEFTWFSVVIITKVVVVNAMPIVTVLISHIYVYSNLTAVSLTARAKHGELPLPMPIIHTRKPQERKSHVIIIAGMPQSDEEAAEIIAPAESNVPSSLQNRTRLGYFMLLMAVCFVILWIPYTTCELLNAIWDEGIDPEILELTLCLGILHSGLSPFLSIASMDRDWSKRTFAACRRRDILDDRRSPSSTNEDALGPFNPRYIKPYRKVKYNRRSSSVLIY